MHFPQIKFHRREIKLARDHVDHVAMSVAAARFKMISSATRSAEGTVDSKSAPRSKRCEASVCSPWRRDSAEPSGSNQADSIRMFFVLLGDHGVEAAHDARQRDRLFRVGDDQVFGRELALHAIQRFQRFASLRPPNDHAAAFEQIEIEDVRGFAPLPQDVVGGVDRIADGPLIDQLQPPGDVRRRGLDGRPRISRAVKRGQFRLLNVDREVGLALRRRAASARSA